jgi:hypothetical protein
MNKVVLFTVTSSLLGLLTGLFYINFHLAYYQNVAVGKMKNELLNQLIPKPKQKTEHQPDQIDEAVF